MRINRLANHKTIFFCGDRFGYIWHSDFFHLALRLTANRKPPFRPDLAEVSVECSLTECQVVECTTKTTERADLEVKECVDII